MPLSEPQPSEFHQLVERCLVGRQEAMIELVQRYRGQVFGLCYRMLGQRQDAEDAAQETFTRVFKSLHRWDANRDFEPWLLAIAGNRCRTILAAKKRRPVMQMLIEPLPDRSDGLQEAQHLAEEVELVLDQLREEYRRAFMLFHDQQMSYAEIAEVLDCPLGTVKTWVHRARGALISRLQNRGVLEETRHELRQV